MTDFPHLNDYSQADLDVRRKELITLGNNNPKNLSDTDLEELVLIINLLRRRSSGPPALKTTKAKAPMKDLATLL